MAPPTSEKVADSQDSSTNGAANGSDKSSTLPTWINEENFLSVLEENIEGFSKILSFEVKETGGGGENYASMMMRVTTTVELKDGSSKEVNFMIKTVPQGEQGAAMVQMMALFPKETAMYGKYLRDFEQKYRDVGKEVTFGPKYYKLKNDPGVEYVLLEDISPKGFKNINRLEGLDEEHTKSVLKLLAEMHAVSAVKYVQDGVYDDLFMYSPFNAESRENLENMMTPMVKVWTECMKKHETGRKYLPQMERVFENFIDCLIQDSTINDEDFNVMIHGDLWANNIMFRHNDEGKREETIFVDFQMSRFSSPVVDLYYFLLSSPSLDVKVACFDDFIKYYHDNLVENLQLLKYSKKIPSLKQLRMNLLKMNLWGISTLTGIMAAVLLPPRENANIDNFFDENKEGNDFREQLYDNPRYIRHLEVVLPWMEKMGYLDE